MLRYTEVKLFLAIALIIAATCCISSCSGGGTGGGTAFGGGSGQSSLAAAQTGNGSGGSTGTDGSTASSGKTGTLTVSVKVPQSYGRFKSGKIIPYGTKKLKITITGEAITTPVEYTDNDGDISGTHEISNVPVGLNLASIQVYDENDILLAQRKHGFFLQAGATFDAGAKTLGIAVKSTGICDPQNIDIPKGSSLYWENWDENGSHTVSLNSGSKTTKELAKVQPAVPHITPASFDGDSISFNETGAFTYDTGGGRVFVYEAPTIQSISPSAGPVSTAVTINGTFFGDNQGNSSVTLNGKTVTDITSWSDTKIVCTVPADGESGAVIIKVHGLDSNTDKSYGVLAEKADTVVSDVAGAQIASDIYASRPIAMDFKGIIHTAWSSPSGIRYSRSIDYGQSFQSSVQISSNSSTYLAIATGDPNKVYIAYGYGPGAYISKSTDNGITWSTPTLITGMPNDYLSMMAQDNYVYILSKSSTTFARSADSGSNFENKGSLIGGLAFSDILIDWRNDNVIAIGDDPVVRYLKSTDHGATFGSIVYPANLNIWYSDFCMGSSGRIFGVGQTPNYIQIGVIDSSVWTVGTIDLLGNNKSLAIDSLNSVYTGTTNGPKIRIYSSTDNGQTSTFTDIANGSTPVVAGNPNVKGMVVMYKGADGILKFAYCK